MRGEFDREEVRFVEDYRNPGEKKVRIIFSKRGKFSVKILISEGILCRLLIYHPVDH